MGNMSKSWGKKVLEIWLAYTNLPKLRALGAFSSKLVSEQSAARVALLEAGVGDNVPHRTSRFEGSFALNCHLRCHSHTFETVDLKVVVL